MKNSTLLTKAPKGRKTRKLTRALDVAGNKAARSQVRKNAGGTVTALGQRAGRGASTVRRKGRTASLKASMKVRGAPGKMHGPKKAPLSFRAGKAAGTAFRKSEPARHVAGTQARRVKNLSRKKSVRVAGAAAAGYGAYRGVKKIRAKRAAKKK